MEALRERSHSPRACAELPIAHAKAWRQGRLVHRPGNAFQASRWRSYSLRRRTAKHAILALLALAVLLRAGMHLLAGPEPELADLMRLDGDGLGPPTGWQSSGAAGSGAAQQPKLIPRIIHLAYHEGPLDPRLRPYVASWRKRNPGWTVTMYSEQDCLEFVRREFPEYLEAYRRLGRGEKRSDFFRYMVVLRHGGVFADASAECRRPLDGVLHSKDTLVAGWDNEWADEKAALQAGYVRMRQLVPWVFAGAPGHPALKELCDSIAASVAERRTYSLDSRINSLERTGAGLFTDVLLRHAAAHPPAARDDPWGVRLLPRVVFGAPPRPAYGLSPADPGVAVLRHPAAAALGVAPGDGGGSSSSRSGTGTGTSSSTGGSSSGSTAWPWRVTMGDVTTEVTRRWRHRSEDALSEAARLMQQRDKAVPLAPVSVDFNPPFDLLIHRAGCCEKQSGADVCAALGTHGSWQPSVQPSRRPSLVDAVVGSMGGVEGRRNVLVDVGAGYGLLSLAAAARGHRVHAFELGPASLEALERSVLHNGFEHLVQVHKEPLGSLEQEGYTCIQPKPGAINLGGSSSDGSSAAGAAAYVEVQRGYGPAEVHMLPAESCQLMTRRSAGVWAVPAGDQIAAIHIAANGWEGFVLQGFAPLLEKHSRPPVVALEWNPAAMKAAGWRRPLQVVEWLHGLGYRDISHSGYVCDERWYSITYGIRRRGGIRPEDLASLRQPTWCRLLPQHFSLLMDRASSAYPETLLFVNRAAVPVNDTGGTPAEEAGDGKRRGGGSEGGARRRGNVDEFGVPDVVAQALAEAALMVADPAANRTAAAVSALASGAAGNASFAAAAAAAEQRRQRQRPGPRLHPQQQGSRLPQPEADARQPQIEGR